MPPKNATRRAREPDSHLPPVTNDAASNDTFTTSTTRTRAHAKSSPFSNSHGVTANIVMNSGVQAKNAKKKDDDNNDDDDDDDKYGKKTRAYKAGTVLKPELFQNLPCDQEDHFPRLALSQGTAQLCAGVTASLERVSFAVTCAVEAFALAVDPVNKCNANLVKCINCFDFNYAYHHVATLLLSRKPPRKDAKINPALKAFVLFWKEKIAEAKNKDTLPAELRDVSPEIVIEAPFLDFTDRSNILAPSLDALQTNFTTHLQENFQDRLAQYIRVKCPIELEFANCENDEERKQLKDDAYAKIDLIKSTMLERPSVKVEDILKRVEELEDPPPYGKQLHQRRMTDGWTTHAGQATLDAYKMRAATGAHQQKARMDLDRASNPQYVAADKALKTIQPHTSLHTLVQNAARRQALTPFFLSHYIKYRVAQLKYTQRIKKQTHVDKFLDKLMLDESGKVLKKEQVVILYGKGWSYGKEGKDQNKRGWGLRLPHKLIIKLLREKATFLEVDEWGTSKMHATCSAGANNNAPHGEMKNMRLSTIAGANKKTLRKERLAHAAEHHNSTNTHRPRQTNHVGAAAPRPPPPPPQQQQQRPYNHKAQKRWRKKQMKQKDMANEPAVTFKKDLWERQKEKRRKDSTRVLTHRDKDLRETKDIHRITFCPKCCPLTNNGNDDAAAPAATSSSTPLPCLSVHNRDSNAVLNMYAIWNAIWDTCDVTQRPYWLIDPKVEKKKQEGRQRQRRQQQQIQQQQRRQVQQDTG